jgi:hypothetical protein
MPEKLKKSTKIKDRITGLWKTEHYYLKQTNIIKLKQIIMDPKTKPKIKMKCIRELKRRNDKL